MPNTILEVRSDCGAGKLKAAIGACSLFCFLSIPAAILTALSPRDKASAEDRMFFMMLAILCVSGLAWCIWLYLSKLEQQRSLPPSMRIDDHGITVGTNLANMIPWGSVVSATERIERNASQLVKAELMLSLVDGESTVLDLRSLDSKPEQIVAVAKEALRQSRGLKLRDLERTSVSCPSCGRQTEDLKLIQSGIIIFLLFYYSYQLRQYACCRECARKIIARDSAINLLTCHITWPLLWLAAVVLPQSGKLLLRGHDAKALEHIT
jgi:hypothetical protein